MSAPAAPAAQSSSQPATATTPASNELDLVFCVDCTSSMSSYIATAQQSILQIMERIVAAEKCDVRFALVEYRDHPPQDSTFVTRTHAFTESHKTARDYVSGMAARGGGDTPEAVTAALHAVSQLDYRKHATKVCVIIADAPPHGLGGVGDGFPNGDPDGHDPIQLARQLLERGVVLYCCGCEPSLSSTPFAVDFFQAIAKITMGQYLPLTSSHLLPDVIIGGAREQISLERMMGDVQDEVKRVEAQLASRGQPVDEMSVASAVQQNLQARGVQAMQLRVDDVYGGARDMSNVNMLAGSASLSAVRPQLQQQQQQQQQQQPPMPIAAFAASASMVRNSAVPRFAAMPAPFAASAVSAVSAASPMPMAMPMAQNVYSSSSAPSTEQVYRVMNMAKARSSTRNSSE